MAVGRIYHRANNDPGRYGKVEDEKRSPNKSSYCFHMAVEVARMKRICTDLASVPDKTKSGARRAALMNRRKIKCPSGACNGAGLPRGCCSPTRCRTSSRV